MTASPADSLIVSTPDLGQYRRHGYGDRRLAWRQRQLGEFSDVLKASGATLTDTATDDYQASARAVLDLALENGVETVWADREYGLNERRRDSWLGKRLIERGINFNLVDDRLTFGPDGITTGAGKPFQVFTAYRKAWWRRWESAPQPAYPMPDWVANLLPIEREAHEQMEAFVEERLGDYDDIRNDLERPVVSGLSKAAANGLLTTRQAIAAVPPERRNKAAGWLHEWVWREFFYAVGFHSPEIYRHAPLQPWTDHVPWTDDEEMLTAWQTGRTGYPIIDAAMRQLAATGQMPNRARMFTAAFLVKDLLVDWRLGEAWFLKQLEDADFAVNNGNWQWGASTGVDAAPYFRIFNPARQAERFDPSGDYVRQWVPELASLDARSLINPSENQRKQCGYPPPIVIHKEAAQRTKSVFSEARQQAHAAG